MSTSPASTSDERGDPFYVGYLASAPPVLARHTRRVVLVGFTCVLLVAATLVGTMHGFSEAVFEFGVERSFEGVLEERPYPTLVVQRPGEAAQGEGASRYLLVSAGKRGSGEAVRGLDGRRVRLRGSLVYREARTMIELRGGSLEDLGPADATGHTDVELGDLTLRGEIVDSKCFLGVMKPGNLKPHRACATLCIRGGVPPILIVREGADRSSSYLLVDEDGGPLNGAVLDRIAEPVTVRGRVVRRGELLFLYAPPEAIRRR